MSAVESFISRWQNAGGSERANYQLFLTELCALLDLPKPEPAQDDHRDNAYVFERRVSFRHGDGSESNGFIDLYRRGAFICEAKKLKTSVGKSFDDSLLRARGQAEGYARALPAEEGRPPFLMVVDVGNVIELYAEFSRSGATYTPYPDPRSHRLTLASLRDEATRELLKQVWLDPQALDPTRRSAKVTRDIAAQLATIAKALERAGFAAEPVGNFLTRCLFCFFAEDVGLLPKRSFTQLLETLQQTPDQFAPMVQELWRAMDSGGFSVALRSQVLKFNGKLFKTAEVLPLDREQIALLLTAARADWQHVEPAIFGTLLERALDPTERHALGAHYTPRAYVERLVLPTVIEPLRQDWQHAQAAALTLAAEGKLNDALAEVRRFHLQLCNTRVLDPACGSANFLYVTLEHMKRLEGEVLNQLQELGDSQGMLDMAGVSVDPHQFLGIEINPRAAAIAEMVLWIGYLQWHYRTRGNVAPPEPVLRDFHNIECRDAVLAYDGVELVRDEAGAPVTRWDGKTFKKHPVTGEDVPDETARIPLERYLNPRKAEWPEAEFVVGNPPFLGKGEKMRAALGDGYVEALRQTWQEVPDSADFVMYWWHKAALLLRQGGDAEGTVGKLRRFGLITTNSLKQIFNRRVLELHMSAKDPVSLVFAIPDHPWVDSQEGASVRIAMTVAAFGSQTGRKLEAVEEVASDDGDIDVTLNSKSGVIHADLAVGANVAGAQALSANSNITSMGMMLAGSGFLVERQEAEALLTAKPSLKERLHTYRNGRDLTQTPRGVYVIDLFGLNDEEARAQWPELFQIVLTRVKPERDSNRDRQFREKWWLFGRQRPELRRFQKSSNRYIATPEVAKQRAFQFLDSDTYLDHTCIAIGDDDAKTLGVISSAVHVVWALAAGGSLEDRPRYNKTRCFETFPFPDLDSRVNGNAGVVERICSLAEQIDSHRKRQQAAFDDVTLTGLYNVLEKLKTGEALNTKEKTLHEHGLVSVLKTLHDELDLAVLEAYGWSDLAPLMQVVNGNLAASALAHSPPCQGGAGGGCAPAAAESNTKNQTHTTPNPSFERRGDMTRDDAKQLLDETLLERLVALNAERAAEEKRGLIRWLRPDFQNPQGDAANKATPVQTEVDTGDSETEDVSEAAIASANKTKLAWPKELAEQARVLVEVLTKQSEPLSGEQLAAQFKGAKRERVTQLLDTLVIMGRARKLDQDRFVAAVG